MGNNLAVKITADVTDLQVKFAVAKAEVNGLTSEMNKLAKASAAGVIDPAGSARLQQVAGDLIQARSAASGYASELQKVGVVVGGFNSSMESGHGSIATATREFRALFDELSSGRTRQTPGTLAILATRVFGLGPAALGAVGGVAALTGGLGYLAYRAIAASNALDQIKIGADFAGNLDLTRQQIQQFTDEMSKAANISSSQSREIVAAFASMHDVSATQIHALTAVVSDFATVTGQESNKAAEELAKMFGTKTTATEFAKSLGGTTQAELNLAEAADRSGEANVVFASKLDALNAALTRSRPAIEQHNASMFASIKNYITYSGAIQAGLSVEQTQSAMIESQNKAREKQVALLRQLAEQNFATRQNPEQTLKVGVAAAESENPLSLQIEQAKAKIGEMTAALAVAKDRGDQLDVAKLNAGLVKARENLLKLEFGQKKTELEELADFAESLDTEVTNRHASELKQQIADNDRKAREEEAQRQELFSGWEETYTEITNKHAELLHKQNSDADKAAKLEVKTWQGIVGEIESAESTLVNNLLTKRKSLSQSLIQLSGQLVEKEIANDLRAMTTRLLLSNTTENAQKAAEQGGLLYHLMTTSRATAATVASQSAQTNATVAGNVARLSSQSSAAAASRATSAEVGSKTVMQDAAKAFSGTYASVAQIPYVGWILAPIAAAGAFAAVAGYESLASLDTGTNYVPRDMMANIHEGEAVVPKQYNPAANPAMATAGGGYSEEHNYNGDVNIRALDTRDLARTLRRSSGSVMQAAIHAYRRGAR